MNKNTIKAPCTILLAAVNVIVFLVLSFLGMTEDGEFMLKHGAMYVPYLIQRGEYYRLFSSMFLHFGYDHLVNNMIVLVAMGWNLELDIGKVKFPINHDFLCIWNVLLSSHPVRYFCKYPQL